MSFMFSTTSFDSFIFDIGNVILEYKAADPLLRRIMSNDLWREFELGGDDPDAVYLKLSSALGLDVNEISAVIHHTRDTVQVDHTALALIRDLRSLGKNVLGFTNMPLPFYSHFREHHGFWSDFSRVYTSAEIGFRKPDPRAFEHVISDAELHPSRTLFIDDSFENVQSAQSLGLEAIHFDKSFDLRTAIKERSHSKQSLALTPEEGSTRPGISTDVSLPVHSSETGVKKPQNSTSAVLFTPPKKSWRQSAIAFMRKSWDVEEGFTTYASRRLHLDEAVQPIPADVFCTLLAYDALPKGILGPVFSRSVDDFLCRNHHASGLNYFFVNRDLTSPTGIGAESDTAAMYLTVLLERGLIEREALADAAKQIAQNVTPSGVTQVFFPPRGEREDRVDTVVCANVLAFLYRYGSDEIPEATEDYLFNELTSGRYLQGSPNYTNPSTILYWITRATIRFGPESVRDRFRKQLEDGLHKVLSDDVAGDLDIAMRIIIAKELGFPAASFTDLESMLRNSQREDGSWPKQSMYRTVRSRLHFGAETLTTAFAIRALAA